MRIMISQPMNGLTREEIESNRARVVEVLVSQGHEIVDSYIAEDTPPNSNEGLLCLGKSFVIMSSVDAVFFMDGFEKARGCWMEFEACIKYGIPVLNIR